MCLSLARMMLSSWSSAAVDPVRNSLEASSAFWFDLVLIAGAIVAVGCVLEAPETLHSIREWRRDRREGRPEGKDWRVPASAIGLLFVILGVGAETIFEAVVSQKETELRQHDSNLLSAAERDAANATREAGRANESAKGAKESADSASQLSVRAGENAEKAAVRARDASRIAREANIAETREKTRRELIEKLFSPRDLSIDKRELIGKTCSNLYRYGSKKRIFVASGANDAEAAGLAMDLTDALARGRLYSNSDLGGTFSTGLKTGIAIRSPLEDLPYANCLAVQLRDVGRLKGVEVNPGSEATNGGSVMMGSSIGFSGPTAAIPLGKPLPPGAPISIFIGAKPREVLPPLQ